LNHKVRRKKTGRAAETTRPFENSLESLLELEADGKLHLTLAEQRAVRARGAGKWSIEGQGVS
jgi:hypothetical protein